MDKLINALNDLRDNHNLPYALDAFPVQTDDYTPPAPPFLVYAIGTYDYIYADNMTWVTWRNVTLYLYTLAKDPATEAVVENVLLSHGLTFAKEDVDLADDSVYSIQYDITT